MINRPIKNRNNLMMGCGILAMCAVLFVLSFVWEPGSARRTVTYFARFSDVSGLMPGNALRLRGSTVGFVKALKVDEGRALVSLEIGRGLLLREGSRAVLRDKTFLGGRYIEILPGDTGNAALPEGGVLPSGPSPVRPEELGRFAGEAFGHVHETYGRMEELLERLEVYSLHGKRIAPAIENAGELLTRLGRFQNTLRRLVRSLYRLKELSESAPPDLTRRMDSLRERLTGIKRGLANLAGIRPAGTFEKLRVMHERLLRFAETRAGLIEKLDRLLSRLLFIDELALRKFSQREGIKARLKASGAALRRIEELEAEAGR